MDAKLDWEVDVEGAVGAVDMIDRGEGVNRLVGALMQPTTHEPRGSPPININKRPGLLWTFHVVRTYDKELS